MNSLTKMSLRDWIWIIIVLVGFAVTNGVALYRVEALEVHQDDQEMRLRSNEESVTRMDANLEYVKEKVDMIHDIFTAELFKIRTNGDHATGGEPE